MKPFLLFAIAFFSHNLCCQTAEIYDSTFLKDFSTLAKRQCLFPTMMLPDTLQLKTLKFSYYICNPNCTLARVKGFIAGPSNSDLLHLYDSVCVDYLLAYSPVLAPNYKVRTFHHFRNIFGFRHNDKKLQKQIIKIIRSDSLIQEWLGFPKNVIRKPIRELKKRCSECLIDNSFLWRTYRF